MFHTVSISDFVRRTVVLTAVLGASVAVMGAQAPEATAASAPAPTAAAATPLYSTSAVTEDAATPVDQPVALATPQLASNALHLNLFGNAMQYGGRQSYGRPRYRGSNTNADGSPKYDFYVGGGMTLPVSQTNVNNTVSYGIQFGGGRMFNKHLGVNLEFDYDRFGLTAYTISDYLYVNTGSTANSYGIDGNAHVMSLSLQPIFNIRSGQGVGAYVTGGVGYYHKVTNFTMPTQQCSYFYGCYVQNSAFDHYTSNAPGFDGGFGVTYKFSRFSNQVLYAEVRYVYVANQFKAGVTDANYLTYTGYNYYPANSDHTTYLPVKFGLRF